MAFSITCPKCSAKLKTAAAIPLGRSVQCPKCKTSFAVSKDNMEEVADGKPLAASTSGKPAPAKPAPVATATKPAPARSSRDEDDDERPSRRGLETNGPAKSRKRDDDDEDERPRSRKRNDDDEDEKPRSRKRDDDDEDEKPRSRKRDDDDRPRSRKRDDDDEDEKPRSRKRDDDDDDNRERKRSRSDDDKPLSRLRSRNSDDDDDDDRPSKRGRSLDEDDDDDRPAKKKKKKKKKQKGSKMMLWVILGSVGLLAGIGILLYFIFAGGGYDKEMLALMPSDSISLEGVEVAAFVEHSKFKSMAEKRFSSSGDFALLKKAGLSVGDVKRQMEANTKSGAHINVMRLTKNAEQGKITQGGSELKAGDKKYWKVKQSDFMEVFVAFPADDLVLIVSKEDTMKEILNKESGKITISERMKELAKKVGGSSRWSCHASDGGGGDGESGRKTVGMASSTNIGSGSVETTLYQMYSSPDEAQKAYDEAEKKRQEELKRVDEKADFGKSKLTSAQIEALKKMMKGASLSKSGSYVEVSFSLDLGPFDNLEELGILLFFVGGGL
jgi:hypothetical protein